MDDDAIGDEVVGILDFDVQISRTPTWSTESTRRNPNADPDGRRRSNPGCARILDSPPRPAGQTAKVYRVRGCLTWTPFMIIGERRLVSLRLETW
jgi:hypothetical protein